MISTILISLCSLCTFFFSGFMNFFLVSKPQCIFSKDTLHNHDWERVWLEEINYTFSNYVIFLLNHQEKKDYGYMKKVEFFLNPKASIKLSHHARTILAEWHHNLCILFFGHCQEPCRKTKYPILYVYILSVVVDKKLEYFHPYVHYILEEQIWHYQ